MQARGSRLCDGLNRSRRITFVPTLAFSEARRSVIQTVRAARAAPAVKDADLAAAGGRVLAEDIATDRDYPAVARSVRDGYAVRAIDPPDEFEVIAEVRAGESFDG